jgi:hypothetical protein
MDEEERAAKALTDALNTADAALTPVTCWCEAVRQDAVRRLGPGTADERMDAAYLRALVVRGRLADAVRKLDGVAEAFRKAQNAGQTSRPQRNGKRGLAPARWVVGTCLRLVIPP